MDSRRIAYSSGMVYVALVCFFAALLVALGNLAGGFTALIRRKRGIDKGYSSIPLVSLVFCTLAWALGGPTFGWWTFVPALIDPGTWMLAALPYVLFNELGSAAPPGARLRTHDSESNGELNAEVALRLLGPMASLPVQRRFVIGGTADCYGLRCEFLDNARAFVERAQSSPIRALASVRELARVLEESGPRIPVDEPWISNEVLIEEHRDWDAVRRAAQSVLREMDAGFDEWECSELDRPRS